MTMFPIRVLVESVNAGECCKCSVSGNTVVDSYAIINGHTPVAQLVDTVLTALGLQQLATGAKGMVEINNWRALSFDQVVDMDSAVDVTADMMLKDVSNHATLRILTKHHDSASSDCAREMRERLLRTVVQRHPQVMNTIKNPQLQDFVGQLLQGDTQLGSISAEQMQGFNHWLDELTLNAAAAANSGSGASMSPVSNTAGGATTDSINMMNGLQSFGTVGRFNNTLELPKLIRWFNENENPSKQKLLHYMNILNQSTYRKHNTKITYQQMSNWFTNARQLQRIQTMASNMLQVAAAAQANGTQQPQTTTATSGGESANTSSNTQTSPSAASGSSSSASAPRANSSQGGFDLNNLLLVKEAEERLKATGCGGQESDAHTNTNMSEGSPQSDQPDTGDPQLNNELLENISRVNADLTALINGANAGVNLSTSGPNPLTDNGDLKLNPADLLLPQAAMLAQLHQLHQHSADSDAMSMSPAPSNLKIQESGGSSAPTPSSASNNNSGSQNNNQFSGSRSRLMFDPLSELPLLERWFEENPHPSWIQIDFYTETLNNQPYRNQYPPISTHNVKIWFKNRRAKNKRLFDSTKTSKSSSSSTVVSSNAGGGSLMVGQTALLSGGQGDVSMGQEC